MIHLDLPQDRHIHDLNGHPEDDTLVIVITYGRAERLPTLRRFKEDPNWTDHWLLLCSDDDPDLAKYFELYPGRVAVFNKIEAETNFDCGDNFGIRASAPYPRAVTHELTELLGYRYALVLDDDYCLFQWRFDPDTHQYAATKLTNLTDTIDACRQFCADTTLQDRRGVTVALSQGGEWIGGADNYRMGRQISGKRKAMNWFLIDTEWPITFPGKLNEDVNMYTQEQRAGRVIPFTLAQASLEQDDTQSAEGGVTETYLKVGTYMKSMYSVMRCPSAVTVRPLGGGVTPRMHHFVDYDACAPAIIPETHRKTDS